MTTENATQLTEFETAGQPTSIDELTVGSPTAVLDAFDDVETFTTAVTINGHETSYLVGRTVQGDRNTHHVYHDPDDAENNGYAGILGIQQFNDPAVVGFVPAGDDLDDETVAETVTSISIRERDEFAELDAVMDHLKTELTGKNWVETGRADTDWGEWNDAVLSLMRFYDEYDDPSFTITHQFMKGATMHAIARYPADAAKLLSSASMRLDRLEDSEDSNRYEISPFSLERLLLDYATANVDASPTDTNE
jgi:hypothetical protein